MAFRLRLWPLLLCGALVSACSTAIKYPSRWGQLSAASACSDLAGVWKDQGQYVGDLGQRPQSLAGMFGTMSSMKAFSSFRQKGDFDSRNLAVRIESMPGNVLRVSTLPLPGGKANDDEYRCVPVDGWARIADWEGRPIGGGAGAGLSVGIPGFESRQERLDFRKAADGALIARWLTRDTVYVAVLPVDEDYVRWARFTAHVPPADAKHQNRQGAP